MNNHVFFIKIILCIFCICIQQSINVYSIHLLLLQYMGLCKIFLFILFLKHLLTCDILHNECFMSKDFLSTHFCLYKNHFIVKFIFCLNIARIYGFDIDALKCSFDHQECYCLTLHFLSLPL